MKAIKLLLVVLFVLTYNQLYAQKVDISDKMEVSVNSVSLEPGGDAVDLEITLQTDVDYELTSYEAVITLFDGVSIGIDDGDYMITGNSTTFKNVIPEMLKVDGNIYDMLGFSTSKTIKYNSTTFLLSASLVAAPDASAGTHKCHLALITSGEKAMQSKKEIDFNIIVEGAAAETVEITLGNPSGYNTYVSEKDLDFTGLDAKAYIVKSVSATEATLEPVTTIAAGEGFIIEGAGEATIEVPVAAETPAASATLLKAGTPSVGDYLLAKDGSKFVLWNGEGTLATNKAYLPAEAISDASGAKPFSIDLSTATGISEVKAAKADGAIYSISGVRVAEPQKGVYIMNGRKVIVK